jgi:hypothetical protein
VNELLLGLALVVTDGYHVSTKRIGIYIHTITWDELRKPV